MAYTSAGDWQEYVSTCINTNSILGRPPASPDIVVGSRYVVKLDEEEFRWLDESRHRFREEDAFTEIAEDYEIRIFQGGLLSKFKWAFRFTNGQRYCAIVYDRLPQSEEPMYHQVSRAMREASLGLRRRSRSAESDPIRLRRGRPSTERLIIPPQPYSAPVTGSPYSHEESLMYFYPSDIGGPSRASPYARSPTARLAARLNSRRLGGLLCARCRVGIIDDNEDLPDPEHRVAQFWYKCICEAAVLPYRKSSALEDCVAQFALRIANLHDNNRTVFAATQSFVIADGGQDLVVGLLAVLREDLDAQDPTSANAAPAGLKTDLIIDFTLMEPLGDVTTSTSWLDIQLLGSHFQTERQKRAAWSLGQLNPSSRSRSETNFLWIRQDYRNSLDLRSGRRRYLDLVPDPSAPNSLSELKRMKLILYHPGNAGLEFELVARLHDRLRQACVDSVQDWIIAVLLAVQNHNNNEGPSVLELLRAYHDYLCKVVGYQTEAMAVTGHHFALHACMGDECHHSCPSFESVRDDARQALASMFSPLISAAARDDLPITQGPSWTCMQLAHDLGQLLFHFQVSYVLLQPHVRIEHDRFCRHLLNRARKELEKSVRPAPVLIWNYLPDEKQAEAAEVRALYCSLHSSSFVAHP